MAGPLDGGIAKAVYKGAKQAKLAKPATLVKVTAGDRDPSNVSAGTQPTTTSYAAAGFVDDFDTQEIDNQIVLVGDRKVMLYGASITGGMVPAPDDKVTIGGATYRIRRVTSDPANAVYVCQTHGPALS